jgi:protoporphyrinogen oxidase
MEETKYLIIGAGISGLTFANYCKGDYVLVEKDSRVGGYCKTTKRNGYVWDYAGHFFHFKTEEFKKKFIEKMDKNDIIYNDKCTKILYKDNFIDFPFQTNIHQLDKEEFIDCLYDLFNKEEKENYDNFLDMLYGKFGKSIVEKFLKPYNEKLYAVDLTQLDKDAMGRFFPYANVKQIIDNMKKEQDSSYNNTFLYPRNGAGSFMKILYDKLDKERVLLNTEVVKVDEENKIVTTKDGEEYKYEYLVNSMPLNHFLPLFNNEEYSKLESEMSYNKVLVFNLGFNYKSPYKKEHWMYIPEKEYNYYRIGFYDNILGTDKLSMYIEIGYNKNDVITQEEIDRQLDLTIENLRKQGIVTEDMELIAHSTIVMNPAYVHITTKTNEDIAKLKEKFEKSNIYTIGRYGGWTYNCMEDCMFEAKEISNKIK